MRILLTTETSLPYLSGVTISVETLARGLGRAGHEVMVLAPRPARGESVEEVGAAGPEPRRAWLPSYQLPRVAPPRYRMPWPWPFARGLREAADFRPEVVHAHSPFLTGLAALRLARGARAPLVFSHHTRFADYVHYLGPLAGPAAGVTDRYLARFWGAANAIVAPSSDLADEIRARRPAARVEVIPTGIDVGALRAAPSVDPRRLAGWPPDSVVAVSVGRLAAEKSPEVLLDATALAASRDDRIRLLLVGGGAAEARLRGRAEQDELRGRVHLTGAMPRAEALALAAGSDVFAFASRTETQGIVLAEALALGLPVVAVDGPGVRDSVRDGVDGVVVPADAPGGRASRLAEVLAALAADEAWRARLSERAAADASRFDVAARIDETVELYRSLHT